MNRRTSVNNSSSRVVLSLAMVLVSLTASAAQSSASNDAVASAQSGDFYQQRLRDGSRAFGLKDFPTAISEFRLACFGMLDMPADLTDCLMRLALAQSADKDAELIKTVDRLELLEEQFATLSSGRIETALRAQVARVLEPQAETLGLGAQSILREPSRVAVRATEPTGGKTESKSDSLTRPELEQRMAEEPGNAEWPLNLATAIADREPARAAQLANVALELDSTLIEARCLRGLSRSRLSGMCRTALVDLETCGRAQLDLIHARATLSCQQTLRRWSAAEALVDSLPDSLRTDAQIAEIAAQVEARAVPQPTVQLLPKTTEAKTAEGSPPSTVDAPEPKPAAAEVQVSPPVTSGLPNLAVATLERASAILRQTRKVSDLEEALALARTVADEYPESNFAQQLVGEIAFRASRYATAVRYLERGMPLQGERSDLRFYRAVSLHEVGLAEAAARALRSCIDEVAPSPWVDEVRQQILGSGNQA